MTNKTKYFVVSDVHSYFNLLIKALKEAGFDENDQSHKLIICGDAFDRGDGSKLLEEYIVKLFSKDKLVYIKGNHEELAMNFLMQSELILRTKEYAMKTHHYFNGTIETFSQLTDMTLNGMVVSPTTFLDRALKTPYVSTIIPKAVDYFETKNHIFVHGYIPCHVRFKQFVGEYYSYNENWRNADEDEWHKARWLNGMNCWKQGVVEMGKAIVCGHFHCSYGHYAYGDAKSEFSNFEPFIRDGIKAIDAATAYSGKINVLVIED